MTTTLRNAGCATATLLALVAGVQLLGQNLSATVTVAAPSAQPKYKAIWEPINYKQDLALHDVFFVDDQVGWVGGDKGTILFTKDGDTWVPQLGGDPGAVGSPISDLFFLDAKTGWARQHYDTLLQSNSDVGWSFRENGLFSYTSDGGRRWTARQTKFPAPVKGFSLPRHDRGYVVGDHGMIYRYRVVPIDYVAKGMMDAPMMSTPAK